jgi:hypothetical protein
VQSRCSKIEEIAGANASCIKPRPSHRFATEKPESHAWKGRQYPGTLYRYHQDRVERLARAAEAEAANAGT